MGIIREFHLINQLLKQYDDFFLYLKSLESLGHTYFFNPSDYEVFGTLAEHTAANHFFKIRDSLQSRTTESSGVVKNMRPSEITRLIDRLTTELTSIDSQMFCNENPLFTLLHDFVEAHTNAYSEKKSSDILNLIILATDVLRSLRMLDFLSEHVDNDNPNDVSSPDDKKTLTIYFDKDILDIEEFIVGLDIIKGLYFSLCLFHGTNYKDSPLILRQVEFGSQFLKVQGAAKVITSLKELVLGLGGFIRDIISGKIQYEQIQNKCKSIEAVVAVLEQVDSSKIDEGTKNNLYKSIEKFTGFSTTRVRQIYVDDQKVINDDKKFIEHKIQHKLENK